MPFPQGLGELRGLKSIDKVIVIDQSPIGRTPRSNPATYTGALATAAHSGDRHQPTQGELNRNVLEVVAIAIDQFE